MIFTLVVETPREDTEMFLKLRRLVLQSWEWTVCIGPPKVELKLRMTALGQLR